ncbi:hypothetical protein TrLO_g11766 [Triparma laevis f. longispina]|uniref:CHCH domain-containing protein n=1 Tax=Triparma laevis f. longispina TaxID=1714387 RepID=A0A9W7F3F9_9STRA|nr:hypothetical protein TrLO_g11766 [Triparma laevis f. longispina]
MAPFVYRGAGKRGSPHLSEAEKFCVKEACLIQKCLARNGSREEKCDDVIEFWRDCVTRNQIRLEKKKEKEGK